MAWADGGETGGDLLYVCEMSGKRLVIDIEGDGCGSSTVIWGRDADMGVIGGMGGSGFMRELAWSSSMLSEELSEDDLFPNNEVGCISTGDTCKEAGRVDSGTSSTLCSLGASNPILSPDTVVALERRIF